MRSIAPCVSARTPQKTKGTETRSEKNSDTGVPQLRKLRWENDSGAVDFMPQLVRKRRNVPFLPSCFPCLQGECRLSDDGKLGRRGIDQLLELREVGD